MKRAPGVVIYKGCVMGSAGDTEDEWSGSDTEPTFGRMLG